MSSNPTSGAGCDRNVGLLPLFAIALAAALVAPARAQMPKGWYAISAQRQPSSPFTGNGGVYLGHPRSPGAMTCVTGLPAPLTGAGFTGQFAEGASSISLDPTTGDLVLGNITTANNSVDLYVVSLLGTPPTVSGTVVRTIPLGTARPGGAWVGQTAFVTPNVLLVAASNLTGAIGPTPSLQVFTANLTTGTVTPLAFGSWRPSGVANAVAYDPSSSTAYVGVYLRGAPQTSSLFSFPLATPAAITPIFQGRTGTITNLAVEYTGTVVASFGQQAGTGLPSLVRVNATTGAITPLSTFEIINAVAVEPTTGELALAGNQMRGNSTTGGIHWFNQSAGTITPLATTLLSGARGPLTGMVAAPAPTRFGAPSGPAPAFPWSLAPNPSRLPLAGNASFFVDVAWPAGTTPNLSACFLGVGKAVPPIRILGVSFLLNPALLLTAPMAQQAANQRSVLPLPLPVAAPVKATLYLQSFHIVGPNLHASDGLCVTIL